MSEAGHSPPTPPAASDHSESEPANKLDWMRWAMLGLALLAFALRIFQIDAQSIWWDEGISLHLATSDLAAIFRDRLDNIHPPLYFILLKSWLALSGVSAFSARYLSALAGWLGVAATYGVAARWFCRRTGMVAAFLAAISAVSIIYSQEVRVYSLLPLAYLALLAITRELTLVEFHMSGKRWMLWAALGVVSWIAIHLHYVSLFAVAYVTAWALLSFARSRHWSDFWRVIFVQFLVAVTSLPWFGTAAANWAVIQGEANAGTFVTDPVPLRFLLAQVWAFHLTGLAGALGRTGMAYAAGVTVLLLTTLLAIRLYDRRTRRQTAVLLAHWLIPLSSALLVWLVRSFSHPRYVAMFVPGLILLAAYVILPDVPVAKSTFLNGVSRFLALLLFIAVSGLSIWGLAIYFFDEGAAKDDIRGAARYLEQVTDEGDLILVPDTDWSLPFEYRGEAQVTMAGLDHGGTRWDSLAALTHAASNVYTLDYARGTRDWQALLPFALHKAGEQTSIVELDDLVVRGYDLDNPVTPPEFIPAAEQFGPLLLSGFWIEQGAPAGDAIPLALQWRVEGAEVPRLNVALRLEDENGRVISAADDRLADSAGRPSDQWPVSERVETYHLLELPWVTPPIGYTLAVEVYKENEDGPTAIDLLDEQGAPRGQTVSFPGIQTGRATESSSGKRLYLAESILPDEMTFAPGLVLQDGAITMENAVAGLPLKVELIWRAKDELPDLRPRLLLVQDGVPLSIDDAAPANGRYPTSLWQAGEQVLEERVLLPPADSSGAAHVILELGDQQVILGQVEIQPQEHIFEQPEVAFKLDEQFGDIARLVGFELQNRVFSTDETVPLTLVWQSLVGGPPDDYVVFAHLLGEDGRLIGQHDGVPANGGRPLPGWVNGEYVLDEHEMAFRDMAYNGTALVEVGLYNPTSGKRVTLSDGSDHVILPVELAIESPDR